MLGLCQDDKLKSDILYKSLHKIMEKIHNKSLEQTITSLIGNTPLIDFQIGVKNANILVKLETYNLTGSVKDRMALFMIQQAQKKGLLKKGSTIIEATTGNTGIAFSALSALFGYKMIAVIPEGQSIERVNMMKAYGAKVIQTPHKEGPMGSCILRDKLAKEIPNSWVPNQFGNPDNIKEHQFGTAQEIIKQLKGRTVDYYIHGVGTGGTLIGVGIELKKKFPKMQVLALEPSESAVLLGCKPGFHNIQGIGEGFIPDLINKKYLDGVVTVSTKEAIEESRNIAKTTGLFVGFSSGANIVAIKNIAKKLKSPKTFLTVFADRGERYLSI